MGHFRRTVLLNSMKLFDLVVVIFAFGLATVVVSERATVSLAEFLAMRVKIQNFLVFAVLLLIWHQIYVLFGMYASRRLAGRWDETVDILKVTTLGTSLILIAHLLAHIDLWTPEFLAVFWLTATSTTTVGRLLMRVALRRARLRGRNLRDMLMVGTNPRAVQFARKMRDNQFLGYRVIGFVDQEWPGMAEFAQSGFSLASNFDDLLVYLRSHVVDEVVVALPMRSLHSRATEVATICEEQGILVRFLSNLFDGTTSRPRVVVMEDDSVITHSTLRPEGWAVVIKRLVDIVVSAAMILLLLPVFLLTALLIKLTSPGPVFFIQKRLGLNKRHFGIYKFRTMVVDAEKQQAELLTINDSDGVLFKLRKDPRVTAVGAYLRRWSMDELPQLFNVFLGDMSLVGPRPAVPDEVAKYADHVRRRLVVKPGLTGLWQVNGRSDLSWDESVRLDLRYAENWSFALDLQILWKTISALVKGAGAY